MAGTYTNLLFHIVFSTKGRCERIKPPFREELYRYIGGIVRGEGGTQLEIGGTADHVHIVAKLKADLAVADAVRLIKSNSSKWANAQKGRRGRFAWQSGYGAFSVSESQFPRLRRYVRNQEEHHRRVTFQEEFITLLRKHGVEFDERYLWD